MVSPGKINVFYKLHNTITAYPVSKMVMMNMCIWNHFRFVWRKCKKIFGIRKFILLATVLWLSFPYKFTQIEVKGIVCG